MYLSGGSLAATNCTFVDNSAYFDGGAIFAASGTRLTIAGSSIVDCYSGYGGAAIDAGGARLTITDSLISGNRSRGDEGGAISVGGGDVVIRRSNVIDNSSDGGGSIASFGGSLVIEDSTISGRTNYSGDGGAIFLRDTTATIARSLIHDSDAVRTGGVYLTDSTVAGNAAARRFSDYQYGYGVASGGGVAVNDDSLLVVRNSTITGNQAARGSNPAYGALAAWLVQPSSRRHHGRRSHATCSRRSAMI